MNKTTNILAVLLLASGAELAFAQEDAAQGTQTASEVIAEFEAKTQAWGRKMRAADRSERAKLADERPDADGYAARVLIACSGCEAEAASAKAMLFVVENISRGTKAYRDALEILIEHHLGDIAIAKRLVRRLGGAYSAEAGTALEAMAKSKDAELAIPARYSLARRMKDMASVAQGYRNADEDSRRRIAGYLGEAALEACIALDAKGVNTQVETCLEAIVADKRSASVSPVLREPGVGGVAAPQGSQGGSNYAEMAKTMLSKIREFSVGCTAPDIIGRDIQGVDFKLSDYRGRVVLLDFWAHW